MPARRAAPLLAIVLLLASAASVAAAGRGLDAGQRATLLEYAERHLGVVRRDDRRRTAACPPTASRPTARRASRRRPRTSAPTCGARSSPRRSGSSTTTRRSSGLTQTLDDARRHGAPRAQRPVLQLVRPPHRREAHRLAAVGRPADRRSCRPSTTAGWPPACGSSRTASPRSPTTRAALYDSMDFGFYYRPDVNRIAVPRRAGHRRSSPCCYDTIVSESRIASYIGIAKGELPAEEYFGAVADVPRHLRLELAGDEAARRHPRPTSASTCSRAPTRTRTSASSRAGAAACSRR